MGRAVPETRAMPTTGDRLPDHPGRDRFADQPAADREEPRAASRPGSRRHGAATGHRTLPAAPRLRGTDEEIEYEDLVRRYWGPVYGVALKILRNEEDARDTAQDVFLKVLRHAGSFEGRSRLFTWLYRITVNASLKRLNRRARREHESLEEVIPDLQDRGCRVDTPHLQARCVEELAHLRRVCAIVRAAIDELPDTYRLPVVLRDLQELTTREAAGELGITEGALKVRLHRARAALREKLEPVLRAA